MSFCTCASFHVLSVSADLQTKEERARDTQVGGKHGRPWAVLRSKIPYFLGIWEGTGTRDRLWAAQERRTRCNTAQGFTTAASYAAAEQEKARKATVFFWVSLRNKKGGFAGCDRPAGRPPFCSGVFQATGRIIGRIIRGGKGEARGRVLLPGTRLKVERGEEPLTGATAPSLAHGERPIDSWKRARSFFSFSFAVMFLVAFVCEFISIFS